MRARHTLPLAAAHFRLDNVPQPLGRGWLLLSTNTNLPVDTGPFFGLVPDGLTLSIITAPTMPGFLFAFETTPPMEVIAPPLTLAPYVGQTWDGVAIATSPSGQYLGRTNLVRVTWN